MPTVRHAFLLHLAPTPLKPTFLLQQQCGGGGRWEEAPHHLSGGSGFTADRDGLCVAYVLLPLMVPFTNSGS